MSERSRIVIADHDEESRRRLAEQLANDADVVVVGSAGEGREAIWMAERLEPDVARAGP